ncbi:hypothetical protein [Nostoc sp.]|uniref:hypothetical protein n=1 Tax=Nostoc sp. TaxID=1180 RepID=UPI002FF69BEB
MSNSDIFARKERLSKLCILFGNDARYEVSGCGEQPNEDGQTTSWMIIRKGIKKFYTLEEFETYVEKLEKEITDSPTPKNITPFLGLSNPRPLEISTESD